MSNCSDFGASAHRERSYAPTIVANRKMERCIASLVLRIHQRIASQVFFAQLSIPELCRPVKQQLPALHQHKASLFGRTGSYHTKVMVTF